MHATIPTVSLKRSLISAFCVHSSDPSSPPFLLSCFQLSGHFPQSQWHTDPVFHLSFLSSSSSFAKKRKNVQSYRSSRANVVTIQFSLLMVPFFLGVFVWKFCNPKQSASNNVHEVIQPLKVCWCRRGGTVHYCYLFLNETMLVILTSNVMHDVLCVCVCMKYFLSVD